MTKGWDDRGDVKGCCVGGGVLLVVPVGMSQRGSSEQSSLSREGWVASGGSKLTVTGKNQWEVSEGSG